MLEAARAATFQSAVPARSFCLRVSAARVSVRCLHLRRSPRAPYPVRFRAPYPVRFALDARAAGILSRAVLPAELRPSLHARHWRVKAGPAPAPLTAGLRDCQGGMVSIDLSYAAPQAHGVSSSNSASHTEALGQDPSMKPGRSRWGAFLRRSRLVLFPLLLLVLGCSVSFWFASLQYRFHIDRLREHLSAQLDEIRGNLSRELYAALYLTEGIVSLVVTEKSVDEGQFQAMAKELLSHNHLIRNVALAPGNVVRYVFPREGNEGIIGLRYLDIPDQRDAVVRAMSERKMVVAGPVEPCPGRGGHHRPYPDL